MSVENSSPVPVELFSEAEKESLAIRAKTFEKIREIPSLENFLIFQDGTGTVDLSNKSVDHAKVDEILAIPENIERIRRDIHFLLIQRIETAYDTEAINSNGGFQVPESGGYRTKGSLFGHGVAKAEEVPLFENIQVGGGKTVTYEKLKDFFPHKIEQIFSEMAATYFSIMTETQRARTLQEVASKTTGKIYPKEHFAWFSGISNFSPPKLFQLVIGSKMEGVKDSAGNKLEARKRTQETSQAYGILFREAFSMFYCAQEGSAYTYDEGGTKKYKKFSKGFLPTDNEPGSNAVSDLYGEVSSTLKTIFEANKSEEWAKPFFDVTPHLTSDQLEKRRAVYLKSIVEMAYSVLWSWSEVSRMDTSAKMFELGAMTNAHNYHGRDKAGRTNKSSNGDGTSKDFNPGIGDNPHLVSPPFDLVTHNILVPQDKVTIGQDAASIQAYFDSFGSRPNAGEVDTRLKNARYMDSFATISSQDYFVGDSNDIDYEKLAELFIVVTVKKTEAGSYGVPLLIRRTPEITAALLAGQKHIPIIASMREILFTAKLPLVDDSGLSLVNFSSSLEDDAFRAQLSQMYSITENFHLPSAKVGMKIGPYDFTKEPDYNADPNYAIRWRTRFEVGIFNALESLLGSGRISQAFLGPLLGKREFFANLFFGIDGKEPLIGLVKSGDIRQDLDASKVQKIIDNVWVYFTGNAARFQEYGQPVPKYDAAGNLEDIRYEKTASVGSVEVFPQVFSKMFREPIFWRDQPVFSIERVSRAFDQQSEALKVLNGTPSPAEKKEAKILLAKAVFSLKTDLVLRPLINLYISKFMYEFSKEEMLDLFPEEGSSGASSKSADQRQVDYIMQLLMKENPFPLITGGAEKAPLPHKVAQMVLYFSELYRDLASQFLDSLKKIDPDIGVEVLPAVAPKSLVRRALERITRTKERELSPSEKENARLTRVLLNLIPGLRTEPSDPSTHQLTVENFKVLLFQRFVDAGVISGPRWHVFAIELLQLLAKGKYTKSVNTEAAFIELQGLKAEGITAVAEAKK